MKLTHRSFSALCCAALVSQGLSAQTSADQSLLPYLPGPRVVKRDDAFILNN